MRWWLCPPSRPRASCAVCLVEVRAPVDQLVDPLGRFADDHLDDLRVAQPAAGGERVGDVVLEAVLGIEHAGDAPLGVVAVRLSQPVLGDHQHRELGSTASAARSPARPPPMISTSVKWCGTRLGSNGTR